MGSGLLFMARPVRVGRKYSCGTEAGVLAHGAPASLLRPSERPTRRAFVLPDSPGPMGYAPPGLPAANFHIIIRDALPQYGTPTPVGPGRSGFSLRRTGMCAADTDDRLRLRELIEEGR